MIDWVHARCMDWANQYRKRDYDGLWPASHLIGQLDYQHSPDGLTSPANEVSQAVFRMRATPSMDTALQVFLTHTLFAGKPKAKIPLLAMDKFTYWRKLHDAHVFIAARIEQPLKETA